MNTLGTSLCPSFLPMLFYRPFSCRAPLHGETIGHVGPHPRSLRAHNIFALDVVQNEARRIHSIFLHTAVLRPVVVITINVVSYLRLSGFFLDIATRSSVSFS